MPRPRGRAALVGLLLAATTALLAPAAAQAGCGGVQHRMPSQQRPATGRPPLMIGDSVLLGALGEVARAGLETDTRGCRGWTEGMAVLRARRRAGTLPGAVVLQLGTNFGVTGRAIRTALTILGPDRLLVLLTPREVFGEDGADAAAIRAAGRRHPDRVLVLDWVRHTRGRDPWFQPDGIHLTRRGAAGLARFVAPLTRLAGGIRRAERGVRQDGRVAAALR